MTHPLQRIHSLLLTLHLGGLQYFFCLHRLQIKKYAFQKNQQLELQFVQWVLLEKIDTKKVH